MYVAEFFEEQYQQSAKLLEEIQRLEREKHELEFQASRQRGSTPKLPTLVAPPPQNVPMKLCLRKRSACVCLLSQQWLRLLHCTTSQQSA